jgi:ATP-dependent RNA helicase DeaD
LRQAIDGYEQPTPIQVKTIPLMLAGRDVIGQAQTGTGKTAAFALPVLQRLDLSENAPQALVLTPTRSWASRWRSLLRLLASTWDASAAAGVRGQSIQQQINRLRSGVHVVVGTPGVMDTAKRHAGLRLC